MSWKVKNFVYDQEYFEVNDTVFIRLINTGLYYLQGTDFYSVTE